MILQAWDGSFREGRIPAGTRYESRLSRPSRGSKRRVPDGGSIVLTGTRDLTDAADVFSGPRIPRSNYFGISWATPRSTGVNTMAGSRSRVAMFAFASFSCERAARPFFDRVVIHFDNGTSRKWSSAIESYLVEELRDRPSRQTFRRNRRAWYYKEPWGPKSDRECT
jgi:hypothetical protein